MEQKKHAGEYALITGATSGFGYEFCKLFAEDGYNLVLVARSDERLAQVAEELQTFYGVMVVPIAKDLFYADAAQEIFNEVKQRGIHIDVLVNDAGQGEWGHFADIALQRSLDIIQLNISSLVSLTKLFLTPMLERGNGKILQVASEAAKSPMPLLSVYAATKAFVLSFSEALANELEGTGVTVTALLPGAADTDFFHKAHAEATVIYREEDLQSPEEVAQDGYNALMSGEAKVISGAKTRMHVYMANVMPDEANAGNMRKKMEVSKQENGRDAATHQASREEREEITKLTGVTSGDREEQQYGF
ncbi:SDR family oxidoreductase [Chitinophaga horti]|uniref:SDR family oxidoreductase n=1 Tax=Chitinophaga horti TaxID=2920382 RepID=A0ABY6J753_9BACT|nr:SDR family oxidoreductase [Chitinophaga horti]UYQ94097.1 SDR family oxidoreductase [Chitinophaga horti]